MSVSTSILDIDPTGDNRSSGLRSSLPVKAWSQLGENQTKEKQQDVLSLVPPESRLIVYVWKKKDRSLPLSTFMPVHSCLTPLPGCSPLGSSLLETARAFSSVQHYLHHLLPTTVFSAG